MPIRIRQSAPQTIQEILPLPPAFPDLPRDVLQRFPSLARWEQDTGAWYRKLSSALQDSNRTVSQTTTKIKQTTDILGVELIERFDELEDEVGNLQGRYTLQVISGDIVTGMILVSQSGVTPISSVKFQADQFQIWNGSSGQAVFDLNGSDVRISGWTIGATTLTGGNAVLDSAGTLILGTSNDVAILSAANATYRLWIGNANAGSAAFSVTKTGIMSATGGIFSGSTFTNGTVQIGTGLNRFRVTSTGTTIGVTDDDTVPFLFFSGESIIGASDSGSIAADMFWLHLDRESFPNKRSYSTMYFYGSSDWSSVSPTELIRIGGDYSKGIITFESDTNLYRNSANELKTDDSFTVGGTLKFGTYTGTPLTSAGSIEIRDSAGNVRKLMVGT